MKEIFEPLIVDIERMVGEQVKLDKLKRISSQHEKAEQIKVIEAANVNTN